MGKELTVTTQIATRMVEVKMQEYENNKQIYKAGAAAKHIPLCLTKFIQKWCLE